MPARLLLALILAPLLVLAFAFPARAQEEADPQPGPPVSCQELRELGLTVSLSDRDLTAGDETGFCLVSRPEEDTFTAFVVNVPTVEDFRAAKLRYADAMTSHGYDVCRVGVWRPINRDERPSLSASDLLDVPATCQPRVVARDEGAAQWLSPVRTALLPLTERTAQDYGLTPHRPLTVDLYTNSETLAQATRAANPGLGVDAAAQVVREGRSLTVLSPTRGVFLLLNLTRAPDTETLQRRLAHEFMHYYQSAIGGTLDAYPTWFLEGQAEYQMGRLAGLDWDRRADAARRERGGIAPRLTELVNAEAWSSVEARTGSDAVYSRAHSAISYLVERWGFDASVRLLHAGSDTDPARFDRVFNEITGMGLEAFDRAVGDWLRSLGGRVTFYNDSPLAQQLILADGRRIDIPACPNCAFLRGADTCKEEGRPSASLELTAGDHEIVRVTLADRVHFPDTVIRLHIDPGAALVRCLALRV
jgi:hypothetical protein